MTRQAYYKAANTNLRGPHYGQGQPAYLPGTEHRVPLVNEDTSVSCGVGLYGTSHRRVAARWAAVVMRVTFLGKVVKSDARVIPSNQPLNIGHGKYNKYRTDHLRVEEIIGVVGYAEHAPHAWVAGWRADHTPAEWSRLHAEQVVAQLNFTLSVEGSELRYHLTGNTLEVLRDEGYRLWEVSTQKPRKWRVEASFTQTRGRWDKDELRAAVLEALDTYGDYVTVDVTEEASS